MNFYISPEDLRDFCVKAILANTNYHATRTELWDYFIKLLTPKEGKVATVAIDYKTITAIKQYLTGNNVEVNNSIAQYAFYIRIGELTKHYSPIFHGFVFGADDEVINEETRFSAKDKEEVSRIEKDLQM